MSLATILGTVAIAIASGASVLYATLGEVVGERAGIVNLGVEGTMLMGASVSFAVAAKTGNVLLGVVAGAFAGAVLNLVLAVFVVSRRTDQLASGLALWLLGLGLSTLIGSGSVGAQVTGIPDVSLPFVSELPEAYARVLRQDILAYLMVPVAVVIWWMLFRTRWGLWLRAVGEDRATAYAAGLHPSVIQYGALFIAGALSGIAGAQLALGYTRTWQEGMTAGRGFLAVAIVIFSLWHPLRAIAGAFLFGAAVALGLQLQALGAPVSPFLLDMLPYLVTLAVVLAWGRPRAFTVPMGLREVFEGTGR